MYRVKYSFLWIILVGIISGCSVSPAEKIKPNVVLILADDMGYGEIEALDPERSKIPTPSLNQLAAEGMIFTDAHTSSSVCTPSRYAMLTGRYNWRSRLQDGVILGGEEPLIAPDRMTLGHLFQNNGYSTALVGKWHLDYHYEVPESLMEVKPKKQEGRKLADVPVGTRIPDGPITRGFDTFYGFHHSRAMSSIVRNDEIVDEIDVIDVLPSLTNEVVNLIDQKAEAAKNGQPFFIYFAQNSPHTPIAPAKEWIGKTDLGEYGDFVAQTDGSVGTVLEALERNGLAENTIVIFSADNGTSKSADIEALQAQGHYPSAWMRGSKADLWDGGHRVPFIARWPQQIEAKAESNHLVCLSDLMATFAEYFSYDLPENTGEDSQSFLNALYGKSVNNPRQEIVHHSIDGKFSIRKGEWKLLLAPGSGGWTSPKDLEASALGLPEMQLYNMNEDIGEAENLIEQYPEKVDSLVATLKKLVDRGRSTEGLPQTNDAVIDIWKNQIEK
ncbi:MAG: arylsulfatase [Reichenbachiella sp.]|uniref:sulfatase family protein n=1 Tax=Reichenbachiella sp. TaxID=2184521 RepID=UPI0032993A5A